MSQVAPYAQKAPVTANNNDEITAPTDFQPAEYFVFGTVEHRCGSVLHNQIDTVPGKTLLDGHHAVENLWIPLAGNQTDGREGTCHFHPCLTKHTTLH